MKTLVYENSNIATGLYYAVYRQTMSETKYLVYECNQDGGMKCIAEFASCENACAFVRKKCN